VLPRQLRYGRRQDKLGRGLGACFILYHDREFHLHHFCDIYAHRPSLLCVRGCGNFYVGALGVVLSWPRRKSDHERVRKHRGGDSGWRRPRQLRNPNLFPANPFFFLPLSLSHVTCFSHLASTHRPALCQGLVRNTMNTVCTIPDSDQNSPSRRRSCHWIMSCRIIVVARKLASFMYYVSLFLFIVEYSTVLSSQSPTVGKSSTVIKNCQQSFKSRR
jgi:hypothetical protein